MKLAVPMMCAWYLHERPLPPGWRALALLSVMILLPVGLVAAAARPRHRRADRLRRRTGHRAGRACACASWWAWCCSGRSAAWFGWSFMHDYQRQRVLTFLDPQTDPLGAGYHIIQSQIAIGSGGVFGKGWMNGSQAQLEFLPERSTDFIFAVIGEEFGLLGPAAAAAAVPVRRRPRHLPRHADAGHVRAPAGRLASRSPSSSTCSSTPAWSAACCRWSACRCRW